MFGADELLAAAEGSLTVCSSCSYCKSIESVGGIRQTSGTIDLASRVSVLKGSLRALSLSEPCISTSGVIMAAVGCAGNMGIMGGRAFTILSPSPWLYHFG